MGEGDGIMSYESVVAGLKTTSHEGWNSVVRFLDEKPCEDLGHPGIRCYVHS